jgi:hypothetical protein
MPFPKIQASSLSKIDWTSSTEKLTLRSLRIHGEKISKIRAIRLHSGLVRQGNQDQRSSRVGRISGKSSSDLIETITNAIACFLGVMFDQLSKRFTDFVLDKFSTIVGDQTEDVIKTGND